MQIISGPGPLGKTVELAELETSLQTIASLNPLGVGGHHIIKTSVIATEAGWTEAASGGGSITNEIGYTKFTSGAGGAGRAYIPTKEAIDFSKDLHLIIVAKLSAVPDGAGNSLYIALGDTWNGSTQKGFAFDFRVDTGNLTGHVGDGANTTDTIMTGVTLTNWNIFEIIFISGTSVVFKVNGTTKQTTTANIPTSGNPAGKALDLYVASATSVDMHIKTVFLKVEQ